MSDRIGHWICSACGKRLGRTSSAPHISTWHIGACDYCENKDVPVTEPRDFGYPKLPERAQQ